MNKSRRDLAIKIADLNVVKTKNKNGSFTVKWRLPKDLICDKSQNLAANCSTEQFSKGQSERAGSFYLSLWLQTAGSIYSGLTVKDVCLNKIRSDVKAKGRIAALDNLINRFLDNRLKELDLNPQAKSPIDLMKYTGSFGRVKLND